MPGPGPRRLPPAVFGAGPEGGVVREGPGLLLEPQHGHGRAREKDTGNRTALQAAPNQAKLDVNEAGGSGAGGPNPPGRLSLAGAGGGRACPLRVPPCSACLAGLHSRIPVMMLSALSRGCGGLQGANPVAELEQWGGHGAL
ncbi:hypothetical protein AAFF_G00238970 [Aldrovandia affinis]|uniref:Uncharacterized protein n=1 Tax=Aldrovandia affinis TaxID=143900 RepID=A0AAD7W363_9TELE|nr:hypothetical protein AAFF_G00238970 [Aldrovandia affinis]